MYQAWEIKNTWQVHCKYIEESWGQLTCINSTGWANNLGDVVVGVLLVW